ncbi:unnamed protein product, partial [Ixodes pacificus]
MSARFVLSKYRKTESVNEMLKQLSLPLLSDRRKIARLKFLFLLKNQIFNLNTSNYITPRVSRPLRSTHSCQINLEKSNNDTYKYSFFPRTISEWNNLPEEIALSDTLASF